jgi:hypothetical protein
LGLGTKQYMVTMSTVTPDAGITCQNIYRVQRIVEMMVMALGETCWNNEVGSTV